MILRGITSDTFTYDTSAVFPSTNNNFIGCNTCVGGVGQCEVRIITCLKLEQRSCSEELQ